jgi:hypothetical protein
MGVVTSSRCLAGLCLIVALGSPVLGSCGSDPDAAPTSPLVVTTPAATIPVSASTTSTTSTSITMATTAPAGWATIDMESVTGQLFPPCCADTWHGVTSPPLGSADQQLLDGDYPVRGNWPDRAGEQLHLDVYRFEQCGLLPEFGCEPSERPYDPDQLGIDTSTERALTVNLDGSVCVVVAGFAVGQDGQGITVVEQATGTEMASLVAEVDQAYSEVFASRFSAGENSDSIVADVRANPTGGFGPQDAGGVGAVEFVPDAGPPLLFQQVFPYEDGQRVVGRGSDVLTIRSIEVVDGQITINVYASYYP